MALLKSSYAKRVGTGRKPKKLPIRRRPVHERRHRKFRGIHSQPVGAKERNLKRALALVAARQAARIAQGKIVTAAQAAQRSAALRAANKARSLAAAKAHVVAEGKVKAKPTTTTALRSAAKARALAAAKAKVRLKPSTKPKPRKVKVKPSTQSGSTISPESYINMF